MRTVLFAAAEAVPFAKTGGLGDVVGSLPGALRRLGIDARVIIPLYQCIPPGARARMTLLRELSVPVGWRRQYCGLLGLEQAGVPFYFIDNRYYFDRARLYGHYDEAERYAFFSRAVLEALPHLGFGPEVIHCHDWHTGLISAYLTAHYRHHPLYRDIRTFFTIHNLKYQGVFSKAVMGDIVDLGWEHFTPEGLEFYDQVNFMKAGINFSDRVGTVSHSYAGEVCHPFLGEQLDGVLKRRGGDLIGIANGIDHDTYNPTNDPHLFVPYDATSLWRKRDNKVQLQAMLGLPVSAETPLVAIISRLVKQKGLDLVAHDLEDLLAEDLQLVVMGDGEDWYRAMFMAATHRHPDKVAGHMPYDEAMARRIWAAADLFLMPSLFEPCGIAQLIAMRYGSLPLVRETGGLRDTVVPYNQYSGEGNGFSFADYNAHDMLNTLRWALSLYRDKAVWHQLARRAMAADTSWDGPARQYIALYDSLSDKEAAHGSRQDRVPAGVSRQGGGAARQSPGRDVGRRKIPGSQQYDPGYYWPQVAAIATGAEGAETGILPVY